MYVENGKTKNFKGKKTSNYLNENATLLRIKHIYKRCILRMHNLRTTGQKDKTIFMHNNFPYKNNINFDI